MVESSVKGNRLPQQRILQRYRCTIGLLALLCLPCSLNSEDPRPAPAPRIALLNPLGVPVGQKTRLVLRGWALKDASAVISGHPEVQISVVSHGAAGVPGRQKADQIGDEQLELDVQVPENFATGSIDVRVRTAAGESAPRRLLIGSDLPAVQEVEPNDGFRQAQNVAVPGIILRSIHADTNVDVFTFELADPQELQITVDAAVLGSGLDPVLTLWTADGAILKSSDDESGGRDAALTAMLPAAKYLITLQDAHDRGGPAHPYRLTIRNVLPARP